MEADLSSLRLSLVVSGALALGAYEAGVVAQLAHSLEEQASEEGKPPRAVVDVICGSSAGAVTGGMLACHLLGGGKASDFIERSRKVWCSPETNLDQLIVPHAKDGRSLLSSHKIRDLCKRYFCQSNFEPSRVRQAELAFTATLTSLDKIPFETITSSQHSWYGASHQDYVTFVADRQGVWEVPFGCTREDSRARGSDWERVVQFSLASAAFPGLWEPLPLKRPSQFFRPPWQQLEAEVELEYADGGLINNLPLNLASLSRSSLLSRHRREERLYLVIEPDPVEIGTGLPGHHHANDSILRLLHKVFGVIGEQSFHQDLRHANETNHRLNARNQLFHRLAHSYCLNLAEDELDQEFARLDRELDDLLLNLGAPQTCEEVVQRYGWQFERGEHTRGWMVLLDEQRRGIFLRVVALLDRISGLQDEHPIEVRRIRPPSAGLLLGASLGHLGGLVHEGLRLHDFLAGMEHGHLFLVERARQRGWPRPTLAVAHLSDQEKRSLQNLPSEDQISQSFTKALSQRLTGFLADEMVGNFLARGALKLTAPWVIQTLTRRRQKPTPEERGPS